jgi:predicted secreted protein
MGPVTSIAVYLTVWWTVLFAILPLGVQSHAEAGIDLKDGGDPGAPVDPKLGRKFLTTTWVAAVVFVVLYVGVLIAARFGWLLPDIARSY